MAKKKARDWVWVSRDRGVSDDTVDLWNGDKEPEFDGDVFVQDRFTFVTICYKEFARFTGIKLKPGECRKVRFRAEFVE